MTRALLAVGCNKYQNLDELYSAENDATSIYEALVGMQGEYTEHKLLLSPTRDQLDDCLNQLLFGEKVDVFTFFFAGHGGVKAGTYYLCTSDANIDRLSASSVSLSEVLLKINEGSPGQSNIIIDACQSAGLSNDLSVALKAPQLGDQNTPGITLLATSAQNQIAGEDGRHGFGTKAILYCLTGATFIQDTTAALDLVEIGRSVSKEVLASSSQTPVVFGLNLYGPACFCRNPHFGKDDSIPLRALLPHWPALSDAEYSKLRLLYLDLDVKWDGHSFSSTLSSIIDKMVCAPEAIRSFVERLCSSMVTRAVRSQEAYRAPIALSAIAACLLKHSDISEVRLSINIALSILADSLEKVQTSLVNDLESDRFALLRHRSTGMAELYLLPLRLSNILAWSAIAFRIRSALTHDNTLSSIQFRTILDFFIKNYQGSLSTMSDNQAAAWTIVFSTILVNGMMEAGEILAGLLYSSFLEARGNLTARDLDPEDIFQYLCMRAQNDFTQNEHEIARPAETLTALLLAGHFLNISDLFDLDLCEVDGSTMYMYVCDNIEEFSNPLILSGRNYIFQVGLDIFQTKDLVSRLPSIKEVCDQSVLICMAIASLLQPNRVAWQLLPTTCKAISS